MFFCVRAYMRSFEGKKTMCQGAFGSFILQKELGTTNYKTTNKKSANHKKLGPQIRNPPSATFAEGR